MTKTVESVICNAEDILRTAKFGLADLKGYPERRRHGFRNAIVFGRMVTFVLQNLKNLTPVFDPWYAPIQEGMKTDPLMCYFRDVRNAIEKQANDPVESHGYIRSFSTSDISRFPKPPNAKAFFVGDRNGGSGWEVVLPDGSTERYYIDLPADIGTMSLVLPDIPMIEGFDTIDAVKLTEEYLRRIEEILTDARRTFLDRRGLRVVQ